MRCPAMRRLTCWGLLALGLLACGGGPSPLRDLQPEARRARFDADAVALERLITRLEVEIERGAPLWRLDAVGVVPQRRALQAGFASLLEHLRALDVLRRLYRSGQGLRGAEQDEAFLLSYTADLALYINTARLLAETTGRAHFEALFDRIDPALGVPQGSFRWLKTQFNLQPWRRPLLLAHQRHEGLKARYAAAGIDARRAWSLGYIDARAKEMIKLGALEGPEILAREWGDLIADGFQRVWFPAQAGVAEWMGDTRIKRGHHGLIGLAQIEALRALLRPGDVLIERRNWYLSNVGLPGFWPHAALYLGTQEEAKAALGEAALRAIEAAQPRAFAAWAGQEAGHPLRVIEAMSEGVVFTSLEHSAGADYVGVLRPKLSPEAIAGAISAALSYQGRPYDFDFSFLTDDALVCTELVYKAYEPREGREGLSFPLIEVMGRPTLPANEIVRAFAEDQAPQFEFIAFIDARESSGEVFFSTQEAFKASYRRPKWDIVQK